MAGDHFAPLEELRWPRPLDDAFSYQGLGKQSAMTDVISCERAIWEAFNEDHRFEALRSIRQLHTEPMSELRREFKGFREGRHELTPNNVPVLRFKLLRMLQLQHAVTSACEVIDSEFETVRARILKDFGTESEESYMAQVNTWLQLIESGSPSA